MTSLTISVWKVEFCSLGCKLFLKENILCGREQSILCINCSCHQFMIQLLTVSILNLFDLIDFDWSGQNGLTQIIWPLLNKYNSCTEYYKLIIWNNYEFTIFYIKMNQVCYIFLTWNYVSTFNSKNVTKKLEGGFNDQ